MHAQILTLQAEQRRRLRQDDTPDVQLIRRLLELRGIGRTGAWMLVKEIFAWRQIANRKQLGGLVGLVPTPYNSGHSKHEQGISKAGNKRLRRLLVELAWCWIRHQPDSALTAWFHQRFGHGHRSRKIGIVAVARKLLIALWRHLEHGEQPAGARLCAWEPKANGWVGYKAQPAPSVA